MSWKEARKWLGASFKHSLTPADWLAQTTCTQITDLGSFTTKPNALHEEPQRWCICKSVFAATARATKVVKKASEI